MKVNVEHTEKLEQAISNVQAGCRARLIDTHRVTKAAEHAEKKLEELGIPKKSRPGCTVDIEPEKVPNSYRGVAHGTRARIYRTSTGWFLTSLGRVIVGSQSHGRGERDRLELSEQAQASMPSEFEL